MGPIDRANVLRDRLVKAAYALHLSAADAAAIFERRGWATRPPTPTDYETEAKRWWAVSDQALEVVRRWSPPPTHPAIASGVDRRTLGPASVSGAADTVAAYLEQVRLRLQQLLPLLSAEARSTIGDALVDLDTAIDVVQATAVPVTREPPTDRPR